MDDTTRKVLKRVVAQFHTGIRKPFGLDGNIYKLMQYSNDETYVSMDVPGRTYYEELPVPLTVDGLHGAIIQMQVKVVHEA